MKLYEFLDRATKGKGVDDIRDKAVAITVYYCRECKSTTVKYDGDACEKCQAEIERGYITRSLGGRGANGAERDHGVLFHAILPGEHKAMCGAKPGQLSIGWSMYGRGEEPTCARCLKKVGVENG